MSKQAEHAKEVEHGMEALSMLERLGVPFVPAELLDLLRFGHAVDTQKIERAGWRPGYDQAGCLATLRRE